MQSEEHKSSFYRENEALCHLWQDYFESRGGRSRFNYSGWALHFDGIIRGDITYRLRLKKATSTHTGTYILLNKNANLHLQSIIQVKGLCLSESNFRLKKRSLPDRILPHRHKYEWPYYSLHSRQPGDKNVLHYLHHLAYWLNRRNLRSVNYDAKQDLITIQIHDLITDAKSLQPMIEPVSN